MDANALRKLVDQARKDPQFLYSLVFDSESVLKQLDYLDREAKAALVATSPEEAIAGICGSRSVAAAGQEYAP